MHAVWGATVVEENTLAVHLSALRKALGDGVDGARYIQTVPVRGYRFLAAVSLGDDAVRGYTDGGLTTATPSWSKSRRITAALAALALSAITLAEYLSWDRLRAARPERPSPANHTVVLVPLLNLTGDARLDTTADAITEDAIFALRGNTLYSVFPKNASFALKGKPLDEASLGRELGVRYVASGSLRQDAQGFRVHVDVADVASGKALPAIDFVRAATDPATVEKRLAAGIASDLGEELGGAFQKEELARSPDEGDPYNLWARAWALGHGRAHMDAARLLFDKALALAPEEPFILSDAGYFEAKAVEGRLYASTEQRDTWLRNALELTARAVAAQPDISYPHVIRARVLAMHFRWDEAAAECRRAIAIWPMTAGAFRELGLIELQRGRFAEALTDFEEVTQRADDSESLVWIGLAQLFLANPQSAADALREASAGDPGDAWEPFLLTAALELTGRHGEATDMAEAYRQMDSPDDPVDEMWSIFRSNDPVFRARADRIIAALHAAGLDDPAPTQELTRSDGKTP